MLATAKFIVYHSSSKLRDGVSCEAVICADCGNQLCFGLFIENICVDVLFAISLAVHSEPWFNANQ